MAIAPRRHAQAIFEIAKEKGEIEQWRSDLREINSVLSDANLLALLENPRVHLEDKENLVKRCLPGLRDLPLNLVYLLIVRRRLRILNELVSEYERLADSHQGLEHAEVITAVPIDEETEKRIKERLTQLTGQKILVSSKVDPKIIGGFVARIGDRLIDGSLRTKLNSLRESMAEAR